eukprot:gb/GECG01014106.1/.p1 GENE.gb/GECG01014106.1/~~gb/GECG01014106.1/.p1  ORF type:complete len:106 (+),score=7.91 gb/GECG01014106.1/:1-318(+)
MLLTLMPHSFYTASQLLPFFIFSVVSQGSVETESLDADEPEKDHKHGRYSMDPANATEIGIQWIEEGGRRCFHPISVKCRLRRLETWKDANNGCTGLGGRLIPRP